MEIDHVVALMTLVKVRIDEDNGEMGLFMILLDQTTLLSHKNVKESWV